LSHGTVRIAVQAKRYTARVGNGAIQELLGGMAYYNCSRGIVVTTSDFTRSAKELAAKVTGVELWDLRAHFIRVFPYDPPAFSWDAYWRLKEHL
jgi:HJR/Mrr/RecB family endonuclease